MVDYLVNQPFGLMISLDLMKSSGVRIAGDQPKYIHNRKLIMLHK